MNAIRNRALVGVLALGLTGLTACTGNPAPAAPAPDETIQELTEQVASLERALQRHVDRERHENDSLERQIDALSIFNRLEDVAEVDFVAFTGPPSHHEADPDDPGADNPLRIHAYTFVPRDLDRSGQHPLIVLPHGGVHSRFTSMYVPIVRELVEQGYSVIAPEYRGSTGYGSGFYRQIDYGGLEIQDTYAARNWMLDTYAFLDPDRVGLVGWSHGGLHALMNLFHYPDDYAVAYAGVPVSDLVERMRYKGERYHALYYVDYHIGTRVDEDRAEYERRSPAYQVHRYDGTDDGVASSEGGQRADHMKGLCNVLQSLVFLAQQVPGRECQAFLELLGLFTCGFQGSAWGLRAHPLKQVIGFLLLLVQSATDHLVQPQL
ncbi:MAG TPA: alpha/beta fold hydrolase [Longimicrobiales bacterium]|nr:alpha/beta fold hydrolase [Longimicrobiales bacterium]